MADQKVIGLLTELLVKHYGSASCGPDCVCHEIATEFNLQDKIDLKRKKEM